MASIRQLLGLGIEAQMEQANHGFESDLFIRDVGKV
jgi:hypothetical protein